MEIIFFTLYNRSFHPFGRILVSDDNSGDMEQLKPMSLKRMRNQDTNPRGPENWKEERNQPISMAC